MGPFPQSPAPQALLPAQRTACTSRPGRPGASGGPAWPTSPAVGLHLPGPQFLHVTTELRRVCPGRHSGLSHVPLYPRPPFR